MCVCIVGELFIHMQTHTTHAQPAVCLYTTFIFFLNVFKGLMLWGNIGKKIYIFTDRQHLHIMLKHYILLCVIVYIFSLDCTCSRKRTMFLERVILHVRLYHYMYWNNQYMITSLLSHFSWKWQYYSFYK